MRRRSWCGGGVGSRSRCGGGSGGVWRRRTVARSLGGAGCHQCSWTVELASFSTRILVDLLRQAIRAE